MYLKIIRKGDKESTSTLYHCFKSDFTESTQENGQLTIYFANGGYNVERILFDGSMEIYFMNDFGKTIDRKIWN
jgi:hypothetical protein